MRICGSSGNQALGAVDEGHECLWHAMTHLQYLEIDGYMQTTETDHVKLIIPAFYMFPY